MDESTAVQMKIIRMIMLADNLCTRLGFGQDMSPTEALTYKTLCDYIRAHARLAELHTLAAIQETEKLIYDEEPPKPDPKRDQPPRRVAGDPDRPPNPRPRRSEEDDWMGN